MLQKILAQRTIKREGERVPMRKVERPKFKCFYCDEVGLLKRDCSKRKKDLSDEKPIIVRVAIGLNIFNRRDVF